MKFQYIFVIVSFILLYSCSPRSSEQKFIDSKVKELNLDSGYGWLVILPNMGCSGCIQEGEAFLKEQVDNPSVYFVITQVQSIKLLQQKVGKKLVGLPNVHVDVEKKYTIPGENSIYPCIVEIKDGKMISYQFQSPNNGLAFEQLHMKTALNE